MTDINNALELNLRSAEYAFGVMQGPERAQFDLLLTSNPPLKAAVLHWTGIMTAVNCLPGERISPPQVWERIRGRLSIEEQTLSRLRGENAGLSESLATSIAVLTIVQQRLQALQRKFAADAAGTVGTPAPQPAA